MDSEDIMETPIDNIQGGDDDEIAKMIMSELEKQKKEKDEIARLEKTFANENQPQQIIQPIVQSQPQPIVPPQPMVQSQPTIQPAESTEETINKDILIIAVLVFILSQPSIQNFLPKTNPIIKTLLISGLTAGGFFLYKKGNF